MPIDAEKIESYKMMKTEKLMYSAMLSLLRKNNFRKIAVKDICEEALISRVTFYARYTDKYNFLKCWIMAEWPYKMLNSSDVFKVKEQKINQFVEDNKQVIKNLFFESDGWTFNAIFEALCSIFFMTNKKTVDNLLDPKYVVLSNFYIGGFMQYILWQVKNGFPKDVSTMNIYLYDIISSGKSLFNIH